MLRNWIWAFALGGGLFVAGVGRADRVGDFEITVQPSNKESGHVSGGDAYWSQKEKTQMLAYKVRISYKGLPKLEDVQVRYIVSYLVPHYSYNRGDRNENREGSDSSQRGPPIVKGNQKFDKMVTHDTVELTTKGFENFYTENTWAGGREQWGKAQLKGITLRVMQGNKVLAEFDKPSEIKELWNDEDDSSDHRKGKGPD